MKNTYRKYIYLIALFLAVAVGTASAQQKGQPGAGPQGQDGPNMRLIEELALDDLQAAEVQAIFEEARAIHDEERAICRENNESIRDETHAAVMFILNDDQQARFEELNALRDERWAGGDRQNNGNKGQGTGGSNGDCTNPDCTSDDCTNPDCPNDGTDG
jgi:hypothetical protein